MTRALLLLVLSAPQPWVYIPGKHEGGPGQTCTRGALKTTGDLPVWTCCPGIMSEDCCIQWQQTGNKPACASPPVPTT